MKDWFHLKMGSWHVYKQLNHVVWASFGAQFIAPLFHFIAPTGRVRKTMKLVSMETILTIIRLSLPNWSDKIVTTELLIRASVVMSTEKRDVLLECLADLRVLVQVLIPLVRLFLSPSFINVCHC